MTDDHTPQAPGTGTPDGAAGVIGMILVRFIVPLWVLAGAAAKLHATSPSLLPKHLIKVLDGMGANLHVALAFFVTVEFIAVAVMVLVPRLARATAVFMLGTFCLVLIHELVNGNVTSCGCFGGGVSPPPWLMLAIDLALLISVVALPIRPLRAVSDRVGMAGVTLVAVALGGWSFARIMGSATGTTITMQDEPTIGEDDASDDVASDGTAAEHAAPTGERTLTLPAYYSLDTADWAGRRARDIDLISWVQGLPASIDSGQAYIIFYSRTCEHCHELLLEHFSYEPPATTVLVSVPESTEGFAVDGVLENPCADCLELALPVGVDWLMTPPVVIAVEDGVVQCAKEAEDGWAPECLTWHGF